MEDLKGAVEELDEGRAMTIVKRRLEAGEAPEKILEDVRLGLVRVGKRFEKREYALIELEMANVLFKECNDLVNSLRPSEAKVQAKAPELEALEAEKRLAEAGEVE